MREGFGDGPWLNAFLLCQGYDTRVAESPTIIGLFDLAEIDRDPQLTGEHVEIAFVACLRMRCGWVRGRKRLQLRVMNPLGELGEVLTLTLDFPGPEYKTVDWFHAMSFRFDRVGLYWFEVLFEGQPLARTPIRLRSRQSESAAL